MRKKWTYVAIVSMMLGVAPVFTGCVDTDEPAGLEQLRGAKAELLKAKAQVQLALAEVEAANARYRDQEAAWMKAKADYEAQVAREKELQNAGKHQRDRELKYFGYQRSRAHIYFI